MRLTRKQLEHIANLSKIRLTEEEKDVFLEALNETMKLAKKLDEID